MSLSIAATYATQLPGLFALAAGTALAAHRITERLRFSPADPWRLLRPIVALPWPGPGTLDRAHPRDFVSLGVYADNSSLPGDPDALKSQAEADGDETLRAARQVSKEKLEEGIDRLLGKQKRQN